LPDLGTIDKNYKDWCNATFYLDEFVAIAANEIKLPEDYYEKIPKQITGIKIILNIPSNSNYTLKHLSKEYPGNIVIKEFRFK